MVHHNHHHEAENGHHHEAEHNHHHHEAENSHGWEISNGQVENPKDWKEKCHKDKAFCKAFLVWANKSGHINVIFGKHLPTLKPKEEKKCSKKCKRFGKKNKKRKRNKKRKKKKKDKKKKEDEEGKEGEDDKWSDCLIGCRMLVRLKKHEAKRAAIEAKDTAQNTAFWAVVGVLLLLIIAAIATYVFWFRGSKKEKGPVKAKGTSKGSQSKASRKSRIGSHKSSKRSAKRSLRSKAGGSKGGGSKIGASAKTRRSKSRQSKRSLKK